MGSLAFANGVEEKKAEEVNEVIELTNYEFIVGWCSYSITRITTHADGSTSSETRHFGLETETETEADCRFIANGHVGALNAGLAQW
jgi:hypothetical protein